MELPAAVKKAEENSEAIQKQLNEGKTQNQEGTTQNGNPAPNSADSLPENQTVDEAQTKPNENTRQPQDQPKEDEETYKQRYFTLKGMYDAEVPRMAQEIKDLKRDMSELQRQNLQLKEDAEKKSTQKDPVEEEGQDLDPDAFKEYGEEFGAMVETIQKQKKQIDSLENRLKEVSGDISQSKESAAQREQAEYDTYMGNVVAEVAKLTDIHFDVLNSDRNFLNFLRQYPEGESESRHAKLKRAEATRNLPATMEIFKAYLGKKPDPDPKPDPNSLPNVQPDTVNTGVDTRPPAQASTKMWSRAAINEFYADVRKGKFDGKEDEMNALEADIALAQKQGRIIA